jgi:hypothetical protein
MKQPPLKTACLLVICCSSFLISFSQTTIFTYATTWKYSNAATAPANDAQGDTWIETDYDDASWSSGSALLHVGESGGTDLTTLRTTTYFRKSFTVTGVSGYSDFDINIVRDDGAVIYVNGVQVGTTNMPGGPYTFSTNASGSVQGGGETTVNTINISSSYFVEGTNYIAVEVHQASTNNSDMRFQLELLANAPPAISITRGPYLQSGNQTALTFRWRTNTACDSKVDVGTSFGSYTISASDATSTTEHTVRVTGLSADTKYWYRIGSTTQSLEAGVDNFFTTAPLSTPNRVLKFVAFGDCGRNSSTYQDQSLSNYQTFLTTNGIDAPDAWLLLGDNAYNAGTDLEYTNNFFGVYGSNLLKNHKLYPSPGNHDYANSSTNQDVHSNCPYYSIFNLPTAAECGGVASGKEEFYSYDIGNVHFLALDAYGEESNLRIYDTTGAQAVWVKQDLAANTKKWTVAYWHHPPYTMGSHNSDSEPELVNMRNNFIRILERYGVDMIINGHSHDYERSYLIKGHYGLESTFNSGTMAVSTSSAAYTSNVTCPYVYNSTPANHGTVYVVAGSTGASGGVQAGYPHNALPYSVNDGGVFYFEVDDNRLNAQMLRRDGTVFDKFTIMKDVNQSNTYNIITGNNVTLTASWPGSYTWNTSATTRSINVTPPAGTNNYTCTDQYGCITDQFTVNVSGTLPISLVDYSVVLNGDKTNVKWSTSSETNSKEFIIERSATTNGNFQVLGKVTAAGQSSVLRNYQFTDPDPLTGTSYYRLSQKDIDGHMQYYDTKKIVNNKMFSVRQVANENGALILQVKTSEAGHLQIKIFDPSGKEIWRDDVMVNEGTNNREIKLKAGNYIWQVKNSHGRIISQVGIVN